MRASLNVDLRPARGSGRITPVAGKAAGGAADRAPDSTPEEEEAASAASKFAADPPTGGTRYSVWDMLFGSVGSKGPVILCPAADRDVDRDVGGGRIGAICLE